MTTFAFAIVAGRHPPTLEILKGENATPFLHVARKATVQTEFLCKQLQQHPDTALYFGRSCTNYSGSTAEELCLRLMQSSDDDTRNTASKRNIYFKWHKA